MRIKRFTGALLALFLASPACLPAGPVVPSEAASRSFEQEEALKGCQDLVDGGRAAWFEAPAEHERAIGDAERAWCIVDGPTYSALVSSPVDAPAGATVVVDLGEPLADRAQVEAGLLDAIASRVVHGDLVIGLFATATSKYDRACKAAPAEAFFDVCNQPERSASITDGHELFVADYDEAVGLVTDLVGAAFIDVVGTSYASARWATILQQGSTVPVRDVAMVSPFNYGLRLGELRDYAAETTRVLFTPIVDGECDTKSCVESVIDNSSWEKCRIEQCRPDEELSVRFGMPAEEVMVGLTGLGRDLDAAAPLLADAISSNDLASFAELMTQGRSVLLGLDDSGERTTQQVALYSAICPLLDVDQLGSDGSDLSDWFNECTDPGWDREHFTGTGTRLSQLTTDPRSACFLANYPDPHIGAPGLLGMLYGSAVSAEAVYYSEIWHGDLGVATAMLGRTRKSAVAFAQAAASNGAIRTPKFMC